MLRRIALTAFYLTLFFLGIGFIVGLVAVASLGVWQLGAKANPAAEWLAWFGAICLFTAMIVNAVGFAAAVWAWRRREPVSWFLVYFSGLGVIATGTICALWLL